MNLPNLLTILRILLIPVFYSLYQKGMYGCALLVFLLASFTDYLDGHLARKWNQITNFGKLADPAADKLMVLTALFSLAADNRIPWFAPVVILCKELAMVCGSLFMLGKKVVVQANIWGKIATVCFIVSLALVFPWHGIEPLYRVGNVFVIVSTVLSVWAMIQYAIGIVKNLKNAGAE